MKNLTLLLLVLLLPASAGAQEAIVLPERGMVMEAGVWQTPTPTTALRALMAQKGPGSYEAAVAVLRQKFDTRPAAELEAFAADLERLITDGTEIQSIAADLALIFAASDYQDGIPYAGAADVFIWVYESLEDRSHPKAYGALSGVYTTGDVDYVRDLFKASEQPLEPCFQSGEARYLVPGEDPPPLPPKEEWCPNTSVWCQAGRVLLSGGKDGRPDPAAPDPELHAPLCERSRPVITFIP